MYPSDLSDEQWEAIKAFFVRGNPRGAPEAHERRRIVEAILYHLREGCRWRALPADFPPWSTVSYHFQAWQRRGVWQEATHVLATAWRQRRLGRARRAPRHAILDSQSVKSAAEGEQRSFHGGKMIKGRSRHVAVDSQGSLLALRVTGAGRPDSVEAGRCHDRGGGAPSLFGELHRRPGLQGAGATGGPPTGQGVGGCQKKEGRGFAVIAFRWIVERTFAWLMQCRLLVRDYSKTVASAEGWIWCAMFRTLTRRLFPSQK